jgi:arginine decarboxylase
MKLPEAGDAAASPSPQLHPDSQPGVQAAPPAWTVEDAEELYLIDRWGAGHFGISPDGKMTVSPLAARGGTVKILDVVEAAIRDEGLKAPLIIRFQDMLHHRVRVLNEAFAKAIQENKFRGQYRGVFPIKVNQLREVVEEIVEAGRPWHYGIEVGSKSEMFAGLALHSDNDSLIICNGYKDDAYIRTALLGNKLGKRVILIAEKLSEVRAIVRIAAEMNVQPEIGMRIRLVARGAGKWAESSGERAKFGLSTGEILEAAKILADAGMARAFKLLHFHIGSQIPDILIVKRAVREAARYYAKLRRAGHPIDYIDVGGGLAVDYDGSRSTFDGSMNYSVDEYARDVVWNIADVCDEEKVPHPHIVSESGRAIVANHCVLVVEAFGAIERAPSPEAEPVQEVKEHKLLSALEDITRNLPERGLNESWHDLLHSKEEAQKMFDLGLLELDVKASVEAEFWRVAERIRSAAALLDPADVPDDLRGLEREFTTQHICNFSVFQSLLDHWSFGALFPVVPIHRLDERPDVQGTLVDITCDSDGKVGKFIDRVEDSRETLPLHRIGKGPYYLGVFLTGAYQDIMGDLHNLFGRVNEVHVFLDTDEESGYYLEETIEANTIGDVLHMTQYDARDLAAKLKAQVDAAIKQDRLKPTEGMRLLAEYERGLKDHTYLSF